MTQAKPDKQGTGKQGTGKQGTAEDEADRSLAQTARRGYPQAVGNTGEVALSAMRRAGFDDPTLVLRWREIVGLEVARFARPLKLSEGQKGGVLSLMAEPAAAVFLQHQTRALCDRINTYLGRQAVSRLRFVPGPLTALPEPPPRLRPRSQPPPDDPAMGFRGPAPLQAALLRLARARPREAD